MNMIKYLKNINAVTRHRTVTPSMLTFITTFKCNARCIMCDSWKKNDHDDLNITEIENIFYQLPRMDFVRLSGGEPFVRNDFSEIHEMSSKILDADMTHVTTNGFLSSKIIRFCETRNLKKPLFLLISLDGMEEKHNSVRGSVNAWKLANETISYLGPRQNRLNLRISVNQTIVDNEGLHQHEELRNHLQEYGIDVNIVIAYDSSATYAENGINQTVKSQIGEFTTFGDLDRNRLIEFLQKKAPEKCLGRYAEYTFKKYYYKGIRNRLLHNTSFPNPKCAALGSHLRILPDGSIPVCQFNSVTAGSLREQEFREIWFRNSTEKLRQWVRNCPGCWAECEILPSAVYSGDILKHII